MLFTDFIFIFIYLPITVVGYFILGRRPDHTAGAWLLLASLVFYGWWDYRYVPLLLLSILANYLTGSAMQRAWGREAAAEAKRWLVLGVVGNLVLLAYFKYFAFILANTFGLVQDDFQAPEIKLPIGISFYCFTQLAYLVDTYRRKVTETNPIHYGLFVSYFPHLIAGPVLHHAEMMPQFANRANRLFQWNSFTAGLSLFLIGLFKKVYIADWVQVYVTEPFDTSEVSDLTVLEAWGAALAYTFQLYFDFSAYSDMALGLSKILNIDLPINFNSPYKALSISDFWRRWHMTLSRFLRDYLYISLGGNRLGLSRRYVNLFLTMLLGGLWHGASWTFVVWGGLHGTYLCINHAWEALMHRLAWAPQRWLLYRLACWALTFTAVVVAWVFFRATDLGSAGVMVQAMFGFGADFQVPAESKLLGWLPASMQVAGVELRHWWGDRQLVEILVLLFAVVALPNSQQIMARAQAYCARSSWIVARSQLLRAAWLGMVFVTVTFLTIVTHSKTVSEFIYFNF